MEQRVVGELFERHAHSRLSSERCALGDWQGCFIVVWRDTLQLEDVALTRRHFDAWASQLRQRGMVLTVVRSRVASPSDEVRRALADFRAHGRRALCAMASVYEADGFTGAALRSVATNISLSSNAGFPQRSFGDLDAAADWLCQQRGSDSCSAALVTAVRVLMKT